MIHIRIQAKFAADPQSVWTRITDHQGMIDWSPLKRVTLIPGVPPPNGLGAVRRMYMPGPLPPLVEEVVAWEEGVSYSYILRAGAPIRDHLGQVSVAAEGQGTRVTWEVRFRPTLPGTGRLIGAALRRALQGMLRRLEAMLDP
jgi:uncharacterized protein YndB with AHSA1/START domain